MYVCVNGCVSTYRWCVVSERLQVSYIGADIPPGALNMGADVMVCSIGNKHPHTETNI